MSILEKAKGKKVHSRNINISNFECDDNSIIVQGELIDERLVECTSIMGEKIKPGIVHNMIILMKVSRLTRIIEDIEVKMPCIPRDECFETIDTLNWLKGCEIKQGFTAKVKEKTGSGKGCRHLSTLVIAMAPALLQGLFVVNSRNPVSKDMNSVVVEQFLQDTCWVWRKNGPTLEKVVKILSKK